MPDADGKRLIDVIREYEEHNYQATQALIGDTSNLTELVSSLYDMFPLGFKESKLPPDDRYIAPILFALACQYELVSAALSASRGHLSGAFQATRRAIESCAFGRRVGIHPHLALVWLKAADSDDAYKTYQEKFSGEGKLFPADDPLMTKLYERYDYASKQIHSSIYSFAQRIEKIEDDKTVNLNYQYFEINSGDISEPVRTLLWVWDTHFGIVKVFANVLADVLKPIKKPWRIRVDSVDTALACHKNKWRNVVLSSENNAST